MSNFSTVKDLSPCLCVCTRSPHRLHPRRSGRGSESHVLHRGSLQSGCKCSVTDSKHVNWAAADWTWSVSITVVFFCCSDPFQDYGMWERGDKTNQGITEINASSIGMAKVHTHQHTNTHTHRNTLFSCISWYWSEQVDGGEISSWVLSESRDRTGGPVKKNLSGRVEGV